MREEGNALLVEVATTVLYKRKARIWSTSTVETKQKQKNRPLIVCYHTTLTVQVVVPLFTTVRT